jgi:serine/threonine protein kinase/uncharacterized protein YecT (DUF1311 family)
MSPDVDFPSDLRALERDYELIRELGQGGMAAVYLARQRRTARLVAIKAIRARYLDDPDALQRFAREARTVAGLDHPNIVRTEAIEQIGDRAVAIIMEHVEGGTVRDRLREFGSLGAEDAESILRDVANALGYAHRHGIVHRDVKPENIFLDPARRRALLSDFGIARKIEDAGITLLGAALGTPQYMSPEQIDGEAVDGRSDIYSLGVLGWELLTGRRPWAGESLYGVIYKQKHEDLPRITSLRPRVPANLLFAIEGALIKDKRRRFQTIAEFIDQLTYNPPPLLSQTYPPGAVRADYEPTVRFRPATLRNDEVKEESPAIVAPMPVTPDTISEAIVPAPAEYALPDEAYEPAAPVRASDEASDASFSEGGFGLADFDGSVGQSFEFRPRRLRVMQAVGLLVPLGIAAASLFIFLSGSANQATGRSDRPTNLTSSAGRIGSDSSPAVAEPPMSPRVSETSVLAAPAKPQPMSGIVAGKSIAVPRQPTTSNSRASRNRPVVPGASTSPLGAASAPLRVDSNRPAARPPTVASGAARVDSGNGAKAAPEVIDDPFKIPSTRTTKPTLGDRSAPSPRCRVASTPDQQACLAAYVVAGDVPMNEALESLVSEMRRVAHSAVNAPDPPTVQRVRVEQRAWMSIRNSECPRIPESGAGPLWAQAQSTCFSEMAASRAAELRDAVRRLKRK